MVTVEDLFASLLDPLSQYQDLYREFALIPLASHVGEVSRLAIMKAAELLALVEDDSVIRRHIISAIVVHVKILFYG